MAEELRYRFTGDPADLIRANKQVGDSFDDLGDDAQQLDNEIAVLKAAMRDTAREIANSADQVERKNLFKTLNRQKRDLGARVKVRDLIDFTPAEGVKLGARMAAALGEGVSRAGGPIADALGNVFGALPPQAQAAIGAGVIAAVAAAAPAAGAILGAAVTGGVTGAGVAAGLALAARDARVQAAADGLGESILNSLSRAAAPAFVPPLLDAIATVRVEVRDLDDELGEAFGAAAQHVDPLVEALVEAGKRTLPGLTAAFENADPVIDAFADGIVMTAQVVGDGLELIAEGSDGAGRAVTDFFTVFTFGISTMAVGIRTLEEAYFWISALSRGPKGALEAMFRDQAEAAAENDSAVGDLAGAFQQVAAEQTDAAAAARDVLDVWNEMFGAVMGSDQALIRYEESWDRLIEELNTGKKSLDINTQAGRDNMTAILDQVDAIDGLHQAGLITDDQYQDHLNTLQSAIVKRGFEAAAVQRIIDKYRQIPTRVNTTLSNNAVPARSRVEDYITKLGQIPDTVSVRIIQRLVGDGVRISGLTGPGGVFAGSEGGIVDGPGPRGVDSVPAILAPGEGVLTVDGLRRLGGEQALLALNDGAPVPLRAGAAAAATQPLARGAAPMDAGGLARSVGREVRAALRDLRLDLVLDSRRVGEATARDADRRLRGE